MVKFPLLRPLPFSFLIRRGYDISLSANYDEIGFLSNRVQLNTDILHEETAYLTFRYLLLGKMTLLGKTG